METATLPHGWKRLPLADAYDFTSKPRELRYDAYAAVPFVPMERIPFAHPRSSSFDLRPPDQLTAGTYFEEGDLLLPKITPSFENGKQAIVVGLPDGFGIATTEVFPIRGRTGESSTEFLFFSLLRSGVRVALADKMIGTTGRQRIPKLAITDLIISLPPLPEQKAIARALRSVQQAREARRRELELERERKVALMEYLFTHGTRNEPTKKTEIGEMPESWDVVPLGNLIADGPQNGIYKPESEYGDGTPIIRIDTFDNDGLFVSLNFRRLRLTDDEVEKFHIAPGDILVNRVNSVSHLGKSVLVPDLPEATVFESNMMRFRLDRGQAVPEYVARYLLTHGCRERIRGMARHAVAQSSINQGDVKSLLIPLSDVAEQGKIAAGLVAAESKMAALQHEIALHEELFKAMLDELMTGRLSAVPLVEQTQ
jgi:type I restriction enzyme S subunit